MTDKAYASQISVFRDGVWKDVTDSVAPALTFQEYIFNGEPSRQKFPHGGEIICPVCSWSGKEQLLPDGGVRIYHPARLIPCRAPADYVPAQSAVDQLVPA